MGSGRAATSVSTESARIQHLLNELKGRLALEQAVEVSMVTANPLLVSVAAPREGQTSYRLSFEQGFSESLDDEELSAVIAHELGHIWIFTHHPYLQTERLANRIALQVVDRPVLERVYDKVWKRGGSKGDLRRFIGD